MAYTTIPLTFDSPAGCGSSPDDELLLAALRQGTERAYETLIERYQQPVYNLVYRLLRDPVDTADIVQEVFLKVFKNVGSFRAASSLKTWIYRIAVNEAHNQRRWFARHRKRQIGLFGDDLSPGYERTIADPGRTPFDLTADGETRALIEEALNQLNPNFHVAVVLRDIEDLSYEEIAEVLNISLGTVKSRILRGRESLRKHLEQRLESPPALRWSAQAAE